MNALHAPLDSDAAIRDVQAQVARPLDVRFATPKQLADEVRRLRGIISAAATVKRKLHEQIETLTVENVALTEKLACRETLLQEYEQGPRA